MVALVAGLVASGGLATGAVGHQQGPSEPGADRGGGATVGKAATSRQPFRAAMLERKQIEHRVRVRLLIFSSSIHERDGSRVRVFSNDIDRVARARERARCARDGVWVVDRRTRAGRRFLRGLRAKLRESGDVELAAQVRGKQAGPAAGFRITRYNRRFRPSIVTD